MRLADLPNPVRLCCSISQEIISTFDEFHFDHGAGLAYLLAVLPKVCDGELPEEIVLVGLEGECTDRND